MAHGMNKGAEWRLVYLSTESKSSRLNLTGPIPFISRYRLNLQMLGRYFDTEQCGETMRRRKLCLSKQRSGAESSEIRKLDSYRYFC